MTAVRVRRIYDEPQRGDGTRILVDRLWPRGVKRDSAGLDEWCKQVAPSTDLRKWYGHRPDRFEEFRERYRAELAEGEPAEALGRLRSIARKGTLTLVTATRQVDISAAAVLAELLQA